MYSSNMVHKIDDFRNHIQLSANVFCKFSFSIFVLRGKEEEEEEVAR